MLKLLFILRAFSAPTDTCDVEDLFGRCDTAPVVWDCVTNGNEIVACSVRSIDDEGKIVTSWVGDVELAY